MAYKIGGVVQEVYDLRKEYTERIAPLAEQIKAICDELKLPLLLAVQAHVGADNHGIYTTSVLNVVDTRRSPQLSAARAILDPTCNPLEVLDFLSDFEIEDEDEDEVGDIEL